MERPIDGQKMEMKGAPVIEEWIEEQTLHVHVGMPDGNEGCQFAFYLMCGSERTATIWYQEKNQGAFQLKKSGLYHVICFVQQNGERAGRPYESGRVLRFEVEPAQVCFNQTHKVLLSIFGSCVSRDVLECKSNQERTIQLKTYVARQSIVSAVSEPLSCDEQRIQLQSAFQRRMVLCDFRKTSFSLFAEDGSQYILIDLIDERFDLMKIGKALITLSNEAEASGVTKDYAKESRLGLRSARMKKKRLRSHYYVGTRRLEEYIRHFADRLKKIYAEERIILHRVKMQDYYVDLGGNVCKFPLNHLYNNARVNKLLGYMYDYLEDCLPNAHVIDFCDVYYADQNHKWGLSPMHYQAEYYERVYQEIMKIASQSC